MPACREKSNPTTLSQASRVMLANLQKGFSPFTLRFDLVNASLQEELILDQFTK
jgi:hypothetical protein